MTFGKTAMGQACTRGYYEHFIASNLPARVTLIGSAQHVRGVGYAPHPYNRSIAYASRVQRLFAEAGWHGTSTFGTPRFGASPFLPCCAVRAEPVDSHRPS